MNELVNRLDMYHAMGLSIIPVGREGMLSPATFQRCLKQPAIRPQLHKWFRDYPKAGVAALLGSASGNVIAFEFGPKRVRNFPIKNFSYRKTFATKTYRGALNLFYRVPFACATRQHVFFGMHLLGEGWPCILPPTIDSTGYPYRILSDHPISPAPNWLIDLALNSSRNHDKPTGTAS